ncbi:ABC transporter permease [Oceanobacillus sp. FSL W7-1293]|uniref:ABC transporter permease n=1 Tax=Oceanobacillus sp. FSL W7-1293 TaxID=2921699 RepID=UPI0030CB76D1
MNIVNKVTLRHLKENKRRTLITIIGVIISVAMITGVASLGISFIDMQQRDAIANEGNWHYSMDQLDSEQLEKIQTDANTDSIGVMKEYGYAPLNDQLLKRYLYVRGMDETAMEQMQVNLTKGRLPANEKEVVISEELKRQDFDYQIGDTIELDIGERRYTGTEGMENRALDQNDSLLVIEGQLDEELREQTEYSFTIVGEIEEPIWDEPWSPGYTVLAYTDAQASSVVDRAFVKVNDLGITLFDDVDLLAQELDVADDAYNFNTTLLNTYLVSLNSGTVSTLSGLLTVIMLIIVIGSMALIYNAFAISVSERSRYLGMLASVGATKRQKRNSVLFEGLLIGLISIPIGIGAGFAGIGITLHYVNQILQNVGLETDFRLVVTFPLIGIAVGVSLMTILISAWIPAVRASKVTAIDAIRQAKDVKLTKKKVKTNRIVRKLFGYEAEIALKNLKRHKKRYQVTVFSLMISVILFLAVGFYTSSLTKSYEVMSEELEYDISISGTGEVDDSNPLWEIYQDIQDLDSVEESFIYKTAQLQAYFPEQMAGENYENRDETPETAEGLPYNLELVGLSDADWEQYLADNDITDVTKSDFRGVLVNHVTYNDGTQYIETDMLKVDTGDRLPLQVRSYNEETGDWNFGQGEDIELLGLTNQYPVGNSYADSNTIYLIVPEQVLENTMESFPNERTSLSEIYVTSDDPDQAQEDIEALGIADEVSIYNQYEVRQDNEQFARVLSIFVYGFIVLITLISVANIFNTISTSIALRRREFATMKSIGMTPKAFRKMIYFESLFYGIKSLLYGLPISFVVMYIIYWQTQYAFDYSFNIPWMYIGIAILAVFLIVGSAMLYSMSKLKKDSIVETLRQENI